MKSTFVTLLVLVLSGCAVGTDRHGRPIDGWKPLTPETSPDPGSRPTNDQALNAIRRWPSESKANLTVNSMQEAAYISPFGGVSGGWLVCYTATGANAFGKVVSDFGGAVVLKNPQGEFIAMKSPKGAQEACRR